MSTTAIHNWLAVHRELFAASFRASQERAVAGVRSLTSYFRLHGMTRGRVGTTGRRNTSHESSVARHRRDIENPEHRDETVVTTRSDSGAEASAESDHQAKSAGNQSSEVTETIETTTAAMPSVGDRVMEDDNQRLRHIITSESSHASLLASGANQPHAISGNQSRQRDQIGERRNEMEESQEANLQQVISSQRSRRTSRAVNPYRWSILQYFKPTVRHQTTGSTGRGGQCA
jgi:hypothetical protein